MKNRSKTPSGKAYGHKPALTDESVLPLLKEEITGRPSAGEAPREPEASRGEPTGPPIELSVGEPSYWTSRWGKPALRTMNLPELSFSVWLSATGHKGFCIWLDGPVGGGKTAIASQLRSLLRARGVPCEHLDDALLEQMWARSTAPGQEEGGARRLALIADLLSRNGVPVIIGVKRPLKAVREMATVTMGDRFVEAYVRAAPSTRYGESFEPPAAPAIVCDAETETPERSAERLVSYLIERHLIPDRPDAPATAPNDL